MSKPNPIKELRERLRLTQEELSNSSGVHQPHLSELENGKRPVTQAMLERLTIAAEYERERKDAALSNLASEVFEKDHLRALRRMNGIEE